MQATAQVKEYFSNLAEFKSYIQELLEKKNIEYKNLSEDEFGNSKCFELADDIEALDELLLFSNTLIDKIQNEFKDIQIEENDNVAGV